MLGTSRALKHRATRGRDRSGWRAGDALGGDTARSHGERVRYIPATAVNKVRGAYRGGEQKSDPRDAFVIAEQLRLRWRSLQEVRFREQKIAELCACSGLPSSGFGAGSEQAHHAPERVANGRLFRLGSDIKPHQEGCALLAVSRVCTPAAARNLGQMRLARWLKAQRIRNAHALAAEVLAATKAQRRELPAAKLKAALLAEIASEVLKTKERIAALDARLEELVAASSAREGA